MCFYTPAACNYVAVSQFQFQIIQFQGCRSTTRVYALLILSASKPPWYFFQHYQNRPCFMLRKGRFELYRPLLWCSSPGKFETFSRPVAENIRQHERCNGVKVVCCQIPSWPGDLLDDKRADSARIYNQPDLYASYTVACDREETRESIQKGNQQQKSTVKDRGL